MSKTRIIINDFQDFKSVFEDDSAAYTMVGGENQDISDTSDSNVGKEKQEFK